MAQVDKLGRPEDFDTDDAVDLADIEDNAIGEVVVLHLSSRVVERQIEQVVPVVVGYFHRAQPP